MRSSNAVHSSESDQAAARDDEDTVAGAKEWSSDENDTPVGKIGIPGPVQWSLACPPSTLQLSALPSPNRRQRPSVKYLVETMDDFEDLQDSGLMRWLPSRPNGSFDAWRCVSTFPVLWESLLITLKNSQSAVISMNVITRYRFGIRSTFRSASDVDISKVNHWGSREVVLPK